MGVGRPTSCRSTNSPQHVGKPAPSVSQHLAKLRMARLVRTRRAGTTIYYSLENEHVAPAGRPTRCSTPSTRVPAFRGTTATPRVLTRATGDEATRDAADAMTLTTTATRSWTRTDIQRGLRAARSRRSSPRTATMPPTASTARSKSSAAGIRAVKISLLALGVTALAQVVDRGRLGVGRAGGRHHPQLLRRADRGTAVDRVRARHPRGDPALHLRLRPRRGPGRAVRRRDDHAVGDHRRLRGDHAADQPACRSSTSAGSPRPGWSGSSATNWSRCTASGSAARSARPHWSPTACTPAPTDSPRWRCLFGAGGVALGLPAGRPDHRTAHHRGDPRGAAHRGARRVPPPDGRRRSRARRRRRSGAGRRAGGHDRCAA